jgi:hypothetical protein
MASRAEGDVFTGKTSGKMEYYASDVTIGQ